MSGHSERKIIMLFLLAILLITSSGCLNIKPHTENKKVIFMWMSIDINYEEVQNINYTHAKENLAKLNFSFFKRSEITEPDNTTQYSIGDNQKVEMYMVIHADNISTPKHAWLNVLNFRPKIYESEVNREKEYVKLRVEQVAQILNLTLDWNKAKWSVSYGD